MKLSIFTFLRYKVEDLNNIDFDTYLGSSSDDEQKATSEDSIKKYRVSCWRNNSGIIIYLVITGSARRWK